MPIGSAIVIVGPFGLCVSADADTFPVRNGKHSEIS